MSGDVGQQFGDHQFARLDVRRIVGVASEVRHDLFAQRRQVFPTAGVHDPIHQRLDRMSVGTQLLLMCFHPVVACGSLT